MNLSKDNVSLAGFGMDCFSVYAPTGVNTDQLTEFLKKSNACQREHIKYYRCSSCDVAGMSRYEFTESGSWVLPSSVTHSVSC